MTETDDPSCVDQQKQFRRRSVEADEKFREQMWKAIMDGLESPPGYCVAKDDRPFAPTARFYPSGDPKSSISSPAGYCAEVGSVVKW